MSRFQIGDKVIPNLKSAEIAEANNYLQHDTVGYNQEMIQIAREQEPMVIREDLGGERYKVRENIWTWRAEWLEPYDKLKVVEL